MPRTRHQRNAVAPAKGIAWPAAILAIAIAVTYANSLQGPFFLDDEAAIAQNAQIREWWHLAGVLLPESDSPVAGRPLVNLSFAVNYAIGGLDVRGYHILSIAFHIVCALLAFGLIRRTLELPRLRRHYEGYSATLAFAAVLLWAVHPLNSEVVDYLTQRSESMMAAFYLLTLYAANRALTATRQSAWRWVAVGSCALGILCKESMATAPLIVALYDRVFAFDSWREQFRARWKLYLGLAVSWLVLGAVLLAAPRSGVAGFSSGVTPWTYLLNQTLVITRYLRLVVWPRDLVVFYGWPVPVTLREVIPQAALLVTLAAATAIALVRAPGIGFLGAWFFITLAPASSIVPVSTEVGAERRMYLPLLALAVLAVIGLHAAWTRWKAVPRLAPMLTTAVIGVAAALAMTTIVRNREYSSPISLAQTVVARRPTSVAYHILGEHLLLAGRDAEAAGPLGEAVFRGDSRAGYFLGVALANLGRLDEALARLEAFVATSELPYRPVPRWLEPPRSEVVGARLLMARIFAARREWGRTAEQARKVLQAAPSNADAQRLLADASFGEQQWEQAAVQYRAYLGQRPDDGPTFLNYGMSLVATGHLDEAIAAFRRALQLDPADARARNLLELALQDQRLATGER